MTAQSTDEMAQVRDGYVVNMFVIKNIFAKGGSSMKNTIAVQFMILLFGLFASKGFAKNCDTNDNPKNISDICNHTDRITYDETLKKLELYYDLKETKDDDGFPVYSGPSLMGTSVIKITGHKNDIQKILYKMELDLKNKRGEFDMKVLIGLLAVALSHNEENVSMVVDAIMSSKIKDGESFAYNKVFGKILVEITYNINTKILEYSAKKTKDRK